MPKPSPKPMAWRVARERAQSILWQMSLLCIHDHHRYAVREKDGYRYRQDAPNCSSCVRQLAGLLREECQ